MITSELVCACVRVIISSDKKTKIYNKILSIQQSS